MASVESVRKQKKYGLFTKSIPLREFSNDELEAEINKVEDKIGNRVGITDIRRLYYLDTLLKEKNRRHHLRRVVGSPYYIG